ncbi:MAG: MFS transporter [Bacteroidales bacterium]
MIRLEPGEKKTFSLHLGYSLLEGIVLGVFTLNEFIFLTAMRGSNYLMGFIFTFSVGVYVFLIVFNEFIRRNHDKRKMLRRTAILTRLPMVLVLFFPLTPAGYETTSLVHFVFLGIFLIYFLGTVTINPTTNVLLRNNYSHKNFGYLFSVATTGKNVIMLLAALAYGMILDVHPYGFVYAYPVTAILSITGLFLLSGISHLPLNGTEIRKPFGKAVRESAGRIINILKTNRPYFDFEVGFMLYGFAFMLSINVIQIFYKDVLELNNRSVAFYRNAYYIITIFLLPYFGKLIGKIDPRRFSAITFGSMVLYLLFLTLTAYFPGHVEIAGYKIYYMMLPYILFHALFAATMGILWSIGSAYFCKNEDVGDYQAVHLSLTGVRGWIAPLFGIFFFDLFGFTATFGLAMGLPIVAILFLQNSMRRFRTNHIG